MLRMLHARRLTVPATVAVVLAAGCGPKRVAQPIRPTSTLVVLLPDPESGATGRARVTNEFGSATLSAPRAAVRATTDGPPELLRPLSDAETLPFADALAALPPPPRQFTVYFQFESDTLTDESVALIPAILRAVTALSVPEVVVIGHTDTLGDRRANVELGLKRALSVRRILVDAGIAPSTLDVTSHGEGNLLVATPDNTAEPRNRRVDITVR